MTDPSLAKLLEHRQWVRALARSLVGSEDGVDDLEQRTWLAALERPPTPGHPRAWLATVVRRLASKKRREELRRSRREAAAARPERVDGPHDVVAEAETHRRVVEAVLDLPEPNRTAVLLRYFHDLGPQEISERLGVPRETVRARLRRGLAMLRAKLAPAGGGEACLVALLPLLRGGPAPAAATTGAVFMSKKMSLVLVAWAVLATGLFVREQTRPRAAAPVRAGREAAFRDRPPRVSPPAGKPAAAMSAREALEAFRRGWLGSYSAVLHGTLVDRETRLPCRVPATLVLTGELPDGTPLRYEGEAAADGSFAIAGVRYPLHYDLRCANAARGIELATRVYVDEDCGALLLPVAPRVVVSGRVSDVGGTPVAGAAVHVSRPPGGGAFARADATTDESGRFRLTLAANATRDLVLAAAAPGYHPGRGQLRPEGEHSYRGEVTLAPGPRVVGRVLDHEGRPVEADVEIVSLTCSSPADALVDHSLFATLGLHPVWHVELQRKRATVAIAAPFATDAEGRFEGWCPLAGEAWAVCRTKGRPVCFGKLPPVDARGSADLGDVVLPAPGPALEIHFQTADRGPLAGAEVMLRDARAPSGLPVASGPLVTDGRGVVRSRCLVPGRRYRASAQPTAGSAYASAEFEARDGAVVRVE